jgi:hypothetical protein
MTNEQATMVRLAAWAPAGSDRRSGEETVTRWWENKGCKVAGVDEGSAKLD